MALLQLLRPSLRFQAEVLQATEAEIGLPTPGAEMPLYKLSGARNLRKEWVEPLFKAFGLSSAAERLQSLPARFWFGPEELRDWLSPTDWEALPWS